MNSKQFPNGLCIEDVKVWYSDEKPEDIERLRKNGSLEIIVNLVNVNMLKNEGAWKSRKYFNQLKEKLHGDEEEKEAVACALLNLVGSALLDGDVTNLVVTKLKADEEGCYLCADSYR